jgi:uncharacterized protein
VLLAGGARSSLFAYTGARYRLMQGLMRMGLFFGPRSAHVGRGPSMLNRRDWLLLYLDLPEGRFSSDQIRVMKAMFLWSQEGPEPARDIYDFKPYDYGPFDTSIYHDIDALEAEGLLRVEEVPGTRRRIYRLTSEGENQAAGLRRQVRSDEIQQLREVKDLVTSLGFAALLKHVYTKYPDFAVRSVANV